jgi:TolB protein
MSLLQRTAMAGLAVVCCAPWNSCFADDLPVTFRKITNNGLFKQRPAWAPDGRAVVYAQHSNDAIQLYLLEFESGETRRLTDRTAPEYDAVYSPDGQSLLFAFDKTSPNQGDLEVYRLSMQSGELAAVAVTDGKLSHEESPCWAPNGKQLAFSSTKEGNQEIYTAAIDGGTWLRLTSDPAIDAHPAWSPDGTQIAFASNRWGDLEIAVMDADGSDLQRLTRTAGLDDYPAWSRDGQYLAFTGNRDGNFDIHVMRLADLSVTRLTTSPAIDNFPAWTSTGQIGFVSNRDDGFDIFVTVNWHPR